MTELVLRGIFLLPAPGDRLVLQTARAASFPKPGQEYLAPIPEAERGDLLAAYHRRLTAIPTARARSGARAWSVWEGRTRSLLPSPGLVAELADATNALSLRAASSATTSSTAASSSRRPAARATSDRIRHIPGVIVQGRYDVVCPAQRAGAAPRLARGGLLLVPDAGHAVTEPGIMRRAGRRHRPLPRHRAERPRPAAPHGGSCGRDDYDSRPRIWKYGDPGRKLGRRSGRRPWRAGDTQEGERMSHQLTRRMLGVAAAAAVVVGIGGQAKAADRAGDRQADRDGDARVDRPAHHDQDRRQDPREDGLQGPVRDRGLLSLGRVGRRQARSTRCWSCGATTSASTGPS